MKLIRRRPRACLLAAAALVLGGATFTTGAVANHAQETPRNWAEPAGDLSILTYNVRGLPAPIAIGRTEMLDRIGQRLARMREAGKQPSVVVLQEAFTPEAMRISDLAGYRFVISGPGPEDLTSPAASASKGRERSWIIGETQAPQLSSGMMLLSDIPIVEVHRIAFPRDACAGYDCLANKGILLVTLEVPGKGRIAVATTHLNSRSASGAPEAHAQAAYEAQTEYLADYLAMAWSGEIPLIIAGDFNRGQGSSRKQALATAINHLSPSAPVREALAHCYGRHLIEPGDTTDIDWIMERARDMQFVVQGGSAKLSPVAASVPFGSEASGYSLSDHYGFIVSYLIDRRDPVII